MATRNVVLTETQDELVDQLVTSGRYQNASEALRAGLRLLETQEAEIADIKERLSFSREQAQRGEFADGSGADAVRRAFAKARTAH
jgi:antitoxin ParD1/3/4